MMSNPCRVKITMDADGPILWTVDRHTGAPIEAFQPDWKNGGNWADVLSYSWLDIALDIPTPDRRDGFRVHLQAPAGSRTVPGERPEWFGRTVPSPFGE